MNKKVINNILKISIIAVLIILGTVGSTNAFQSTEGFLFRDANGNLTGKSYSGSKASIDPNNIGFDTLESTSNGILCDQLGHELKNKPGAPDPNGFTMTTNQYPENVTSRYVYDNVYHSGASLSEAFILAQIPEDSSGVISHWARQAQWAWWNHGSVGGNVVALSAFDFESVKSPFSELYNFNNLLGADLEKKEEKSLTEQMKAILKDDYSKLNLSKADEDELNNSGIDTPLSLWFYLKQDRTFATDENLGNSNNVNNPIASLNIEGSKLDGMEDKLHHALLEESLVDANGNSIYGDDVQLSVDDKTLDESAKKFIQSGDYESFNNTYLKDNSSELKDDYKAKINDDNVTVKYNEEFKAWLVGPLTLNYVDYTSAGNRFAGITEHHLDGKYRNNDTAKSLDYIQGAAVNGLQPSEYTFVTEDMQKFSNYYNYPTSGVPFYIAIGYDENLEQIANFGFTDQYLIAESEGYTVYSDGHYVDYDWTTEISVTLYSNWSTTNYCEDCGYYLDNDYNSYTMPIKVTLNEYCNSVATAENLVKNTSEYSTFLANRDSKMPYGYYSRVPGHIGHSVYKNSTASTPVFQNLSWVSKATPKSIVGDAQDLIQAGRSTIKYGKSEDSINIPWVVPITIEKEVVNGENKELQDDQEFYFEICKELPEINGKASDKALYQASVKAGEAIQFEVASDVVIGGYYVVETDEHHLSYDNWVKAGKPENSLWNNYTPRNIVEENGQKYLGVDKTDSKIHHIENERKSNRTRIEVIKKIPHGTADVNERFYFQIAFDRNEKYVKDLEDYDKVLMNAGFLRDEFDKSTRFYMSLSDNGKRIQSWNRAGNAREFGSVTVYQEGNYDVIKFTSDEIVWNSDNEYKLEIYEVDSVGNTKSQNPDSTWSRWEEVSIVDNKYVLEDGKIVQTVVENAPLPVNVDLSLFKVDSTNPDNKENVVLYVSVKKLYKNADGNWYMDLVDYRTIDAQTNGSAEDYKYSINNPEADAYYFVDITEKQSENYNWTGFGVDSDVAEFDFQAGSVLDVPSDEELEALKAGNWGVYRDSNVNVIYAARKLLNTTPGAHNTYTANVENTKNVEYTAFRINKELLNYSKDVPKDRTFYFKVGIASENGKIVKDYTSEFFGVDLIKVVYNESANGYVLVSDIIEWPFDTDSVDLTLVEVDQYGVEYPGLMELSTLEADSIWHKYTQVEMKNFVLPFNKNDYKNLQNVAKAMYSSEETDVEVKEFKVTNAMNYKGKIVVEKAVSAPVTEDTSFYFQLKSLNDSFENIADNKTVYDYFNKDDVVELKDGTKAVKVEVKKGELTATVESNEISWTSNKENPMFSISEVDQYGQTYSVAKINHADSIWHKYKPGMVNGSTNIYGKYTGQILPDADNQLNCIETVKFENTLFTANTGIVIKKLVMDSETGTPSAPEAHEKFYYNIDYTSTESREIQSDNVELSVENNWEFSRNDLKFISENEVITVIATEVDENNVDYEYWESHKEEFEHSIWNDFKPTTDITNNLKPGQIKRELKASDRDNVFDVSGTLIGLNIGNTTEKDLYGKLAIGKTVVDTNGTNRNAELKDNTFFFIVKDENENNIVSKLFDETIQLPSSEDAIAVNVGDIKTSRTLTWKEGEEAPKYTVYEVDQYGQTKAEFDDKANSNVKGRKENSDEENSIWNEYNPEYNNGKEITLVAYNSAEEAEIAENVTTCQYTNTKTGDYWDMAVIKHQDNGPVQEDEHFYVEIAKNKEDNILTDKELSVIFPKYTDQIVKLGDKYALHLYKDHDSIFSAEKILDSRDVYYVIEVDEEGNKYAEADKNKEGTIFNRFTIEDTTNGKDGVYKVSSDFMQNALINNLSEDVARVKVGKQLKPGQSTDRDFKFQILEQQENGSFELKHEFTLKANETQEFEYSWRKNEESPVIKIVEAGDIPETITIDGVAHKADEDIAIKLVADHIYSYTFENDIENKGKLRLTKVVKDGASAEYHFQYEYEIYDAEGNFVSKTPSKDIYVAAGETKETEEISWNNDQTVKYIIRELDVDASKVEIKVDNGEFATGNEVEGYLPNEKSSVVSVTCKNNDMQAGGIRAIKGFVTQKNQTVLDAMKDLPDDYSINFTLTVKPGENSMFTYDGKTYSSKENETLVLNKSISKAELVSFYEVEDSDKDEMLVFDIAKDAISWPKGSSEPTYTFEEDAGTKFVQEKGTVNTTGALVAGEQVEGKIVNLPDKTEGWTLVITDISGLVWNDVNLPNKQSENQPQGGHDGKYMGEYNVTNAAGEKYTDALIENGVYVKLARVYYHKNANNEYEEIYRMYNGEPMLIGYDAENKKATLSTEKLFFLNNVEYTENGTEKIVTGKDYVEVKDGKYNFKDVSVPALTTIESNAGISIDNGWRVRYDVEFYYDGVTYEPTDFLVGSNGNVNEYVAEPNDPRFIGDAQNNYFGGNSFATEIGDTRTAFNEMHANVGNITKMNEAGESKGYIGEATVNYVKGNDIEANGRFIRQSKGTVDLGVTGDNFDADRKMVKASTVNAGIRYMLSDDNDFLYLDLGSANGENVVYGIDSNITKGEFKVYKKVYDYANHINLGLVERAGTATTIEKTINSAIMVINEKVYTYDFQPTEYKFTLNKLSENDKEQIVNELLKVATENKDIKKLNVYDSDYYYRTSMYKNTESYDALEKFYKAIHREYSTDNQEIDGLIKSKELQIYLTYRITLANGSEAYDVKVSSIDDYSENALEYVDVTTGYLADKVGATYNQGRGLYAYVGEKNEDGTPKLTNIINPVYADNSFTATEYNNLVSMGEMLTINGEARKFNKHTIKKDIVLKAGSTQTFYTTYRVADYEKFDGKDLTIGEKRNTAEIAEFTAYYKDTEKPAAVIDIASAPGNYNLSNKTYMYTEADTDYAITMVGFPVEEENQERYIKGIARLDKDGNGILNDEDYKLSNVTTKLVEVMDIPVYNENLELQGIDNMPLYKEYEFYWDADSVVTNKDGEYILNTSTVNSEVHRGLVAGNYEVRFFYGDKSDVVIEGATGLPTINGMDYKTTTYEAGVEHAEYINNEWYTNSSTDRNEARDNEARRLVVIGNNQYLTNKNTSIFNVADYANADSYAKAKLRGLEDVYSRLTTVEKDALYTKLKNDYTSYRSILFQAPEYTNGSTAYNGIIYASNYTMFADSAKINLQQDGDKIEGVNLGLEERAKSNIILDKQIKEITFTSTGNDGREIFHVAYDVYYGTRKDFKVNGKEVENAELIYNENGKQVYVALVVDESSIIGDDLLNKANDRIKDDGKLVQGFRYINVDSLTLQGLQVSIRYQLTAINLSDIDTMGQTLSRIMKLETEAEQINELQNAIDALSTPNYVINSSEDRLLMICDNEALRLSEKPYGYFVGHSYYEGNASANKDDIVNVKVTRVVDYVDNDMNVSSESDDTERWNLIANSEALKQYLDENVFIDGKVLNEIELPFRDGHIALTNQGDNEFVKELKPLASIERNEKDSLPTESQAISYITLSDVKSATDIGDYGVDNYAEILEVLNPVATRDRSAVYGNYDPKLGAIGVTEGDETATELITLSPPTGNEDNERFMANLFGVIAVFAVLGGAGTAITLRISKKRDE